MRGRMQYSLTGSLSIMSVCLATAIVFFLQHKKIVKIGSELFSLATKVHTFDENFRDQIRVTFSSHRYITRALVPIDSMF